VAKERPTIVDVARHAGVSKGAVSFALNGRDGVSGVTRDRILAAADELDWRPSHRARSLSVSRAFALGLVLARAPELLGADPFYPSFIAGVETVLAPAGYSLLLKVVSRTAEEDGYRNLAAEGRVDGVFLSDLRRGDPRLELLSELGLPAVTLNRPDTASRLPAVYMNDQDGIRAAVRHLVGIGHTRIAHVSGPLEFVHSLSRRDAWAAAMDESRLPAGPLVVSDFTAAGGAAATAQLLSMADPPTAIVFANDLMAIAGLGIAHQRGMRVPEDLSVTGYDGTALGAHVHPPLTTVTTNPFRWGRAAARTLLRLVSQDVSRVADVRLGPGPLEIRTSTAPPPSRRSTSPPRHPTAAATTRKIPSSRKEKR
jgi:DNA-binding LacI/PurR family transcriptional regulator